MRGSSLHASSTRATAAAGEAADNDVEEGDDGVDDGFETRGDGINNRHDAVADGPEDGLDLLRWLEWVFWRMTRRERKDVRMILRHPWLRYCVVMI